VADAWNGSNWTSQAVPLPSDNNGGQLSSVSCTSAADCTAVGNYNQSTGGEVTLAEHWAGTAWTIEPTPNAATAIASYLTGVSCTAAAGCTAVGQYQNTSNMRVTLAEHYS
jgi:predicted aminopeptidase